MIYSSLQKKKSFSCSVLIKKKIVKSCIRLYIILIIHVSTRIKYFCTNLLILFMNFNKASAKIYVASLSW